MKPVPRELVEHLIPKNSDTGLKPRRVDEEANMSGGLVYATVENECAAKIYLYVEDGEDIQLAKRSDWVYALCSHNGKLYDGGSYDKVYETLENKVVAKRSGWVEALCSHNGKLYDGGYNKVYETLENKVVAKRSGWVKALCSHNGKLYDGGSYDKVYETLSSKLLVEKYITAMCSVDKEIVSKILEAGK